MTPGLQPESQPPPINYIDGHRLNKALRAGIHRLLAERDQINRINVFPVADGDTGTNLALTMSSIAACLRERPSASAGALLNDVADAALDGARGNSGAIFAQFFQGLADYCGENERIGLADLPPALQLASQYARAALDKPLDGTVLTVITDVATEATALTAQRIGNLGQFFQTLVLRAKSSLEETRYGLESMRRANVVDAGARGFVLLLEGIAEYVASGIVHDAPELPPDQDDIAAEMALAVADSAQEFRFCTECMLTGDSMDRRRLREELSTLGNSVVLAGTHRKLKIHIHTNHPEQVFECAAHYGVVSATKADDMQQQVRSASQTGVGAVVVTDSAADLPDWAYEKLGIHVVPLRINFGDRSYMDKLSLSPAEFFEELRHNPVFPRTSQPAPGDFRRVYEFLASHFPQVVSISMTRTVSGTWQAAVSAAERVRSGRPVHVVDSHSLSVGEGLIVMHAAECVQAGLRSDRLMEAIDSSIARTRVYGLVPDLSWAVRGGRIPAWLQRIVERLGLAPIFRIDDSGELKTRGLTRSRGDLAGALARYVTRRIVPGHRYRVAVAHADWPEAAKHLAALLGDAIAMPEPVWIVDTSAVLGTHAGPGTLIVGIQQIGGPLFADADAPVKQPQGKPEQSEQKHQNDPVGHPDIDV